MDSLSSYAKHAGSVQQSCLDCCQGRLPQDTIGFAQEAGELSQQWFQYRAQVQAEGRLGYRCKSLHSCESGDLVPQALQQHLKYSRDGSSCMLEEKWLSRGLGFEGKDADKNEVCVGNMVSLTNPDNSEGCFFENLKKEKKS